MYGHIAVGVAFNGKTFNIPSHTGEPQFTFHMRLRTIRSHKAMGVEPLTYAHGHIFSIPFPPVTSGQATRASRQYASIHNSMKPCNDMKKGSRHWGGFPHISYGTGRCQPNHFFFDFFEASTRAKVSLAASSGSWV